MRDDARERVGGSSSRARATIRRRRRPPLANRARRGAIRPVSQRGDVRVANGVAPRRQRATRDASSSTRRQRASKANLRRQLAKRVARERGSPTRKGRPRVETSRDSFPSSRANRVVDTSSRRSRRRRRESPPANAPSRASRVAKRGYRHHDAPRHHDATRDATRGERTRALAKSNRAQKSGPRAKHRASSPVDDASAETRRVDAFAPRCETTRARSSRRRERARLRHDARARRRRRRVAPSNDAPFRQTHFASTRDSRRQAFLPRGFRGPTFRPTSPRARERTNERDLRRRRAPRSKSRANVAVFRLTRVRGVAAASPRLIRGDATRGGGLRATRRRR